ncbi:NADH-quinone oxidoreductase subunit I [uncultured Fibrobacter sp.]|uniref:NuoI/complex I 23 kDa subunit family protein n=1 Tax=uncultured Fibrobacter sp. TaxID=261512 RepID=UPI001B1F43F6|nr:NADH-quinone oxidoreductase subunit I [uncultured Fibrobacter sp.]MBO7106070.1 NADH-quinone oxidoreductase subunit I [Fibrobacter sp.]MBR3669612.1 NADH-quinone oxidoreductase subunit I [Fibrobacter sp.]
MQENLTLIQYFKRYLKRCITGPWSLICGLSVSLKYFLSPWKIVTEQYPENKKTLKMHERYRGRLEMVEDEQGNNRCTACGMCERACPNASINVLSTKNIAGKKVLGRYVYHFASCTQCGLCVEACPFGAIVMSPAFEVATTDPSSLEMILNKKEGQG